jgi:hypothetical protein
MQAFVKREGHSGVKQDAVPLGVDLAACGAFADRLTRAAAA